LNALTPASGSELRPVSRNIVLNAHHTTNRLDWVWRWISTYTVLVQ
jgi:hypothetical protein